MVALIAATTIQSGRRKTLSSPTTPIRVVAATVEAPPASIERTSNRGRRRQQRSPPTLIGEVATVIEATLVAVRSIHPIRMHHVPPLSKIR
ncbi:hypothetical protein CRG98_009105 [Punica granatum]|uniref:Uncharacterized protein n=1 Tax=Punica granatum TaxID=22663 RepID=A0A2I0KQI8_PUNGR|nr:hypothetical protein CRG98_009105 [Punica granatum]